MLPLNYAVLKVFENEEGALCTDDVMDRMRDDYKNYRAFKEANISEALMSGEVNGLLDEVSFNLDENKKLHIYYKINDEGKKAIKKYLK
ncbi:MAG: hypothetical protein VB031_03930 [Eubacteriaceae bacterium]|nr:hypothetical protein [Eubacteriaceae bacterium]